MSPDTKSTESTKAPGFKDLGNLTQTPVRRLETFELAAVLTREDQDSIYLADPQGTWVIKRSDVLAVDEWKNHTVPEFMSGSGRPVRVSIKDGATMYEIRPWQVGHVEIGHKASEVVDKVFTLGGAPLPVSERSVVGENQLRLLERHFARRIGWAPDYVPGANPDSTPRHSCYSGTWVLYNGYCDVDCGF